MQIFFSISNCFSQTNSIYSYQLYKVVKIDSTENYYLIFLTKNIDTLIEHQNIPNLIKTNDCNNNYSIKGYNLDYSILLSKKNSSLHKNIYVDNILNLTLDYPCKTIKSMSSSPSNFHIGYGDYIENFENFNFCYSIELFSLHYTKNSDSIFYFNSLKEQMYYFDASMLYVWMNYSNSNTCYSKWLKTLIVNSHQIEILNKKKDFILYKDSDCLNPSKTINTDEFAKNGIISAKIFYQKKHHAFVQIGDSFNTYYGWAKIKQKKNSKNNIH